VVQIIQERLLTLALERAQKEIVVQITREHSLTLHQERVQKEIVAQVIRNLSPLFLRDQSLEKLETHPPPKDNTLGARALKDNY
jgi:hypothetical protein